MYSCVVTVMIYGAVVHHPSEAGACLGRCLVDALSQGLESKQITDVHTGILTYIAIHYSLISHYSPHSLPDDKNLALHSCRPLAPQITM